MDLGLRGKKVFVAASSQGLGKSVAEAFASEGADVAICSRDIKNLKLAKKEIEEISGKSILAIQGDLSQEKDRIKVAEEVLRSFGKIDVLVTNTGGPPTGKFETFSLEDWKSTYDLLLASAIHLIQLFLPSMKEQNEGRIITITSQAVRQPVDNLILSNTIRVSLVGLVKSLANELGQYGITVNNVMPGFTKTERLSKLINQNPDLLKALEQIPLKRFAEPEEFAAAVVFLASEKASYITGSSLAVDGGWIKGTF